MDDSGKTQSFLQLHGDPGNHEQLSQLEPTSAQWTKGNRMNHRAPRMTVMAVLNLKVSRTASVTLMDQNEGAEPT